MLYIPYIHIELEAFLPPTAKALYMPISTCPHCKIPMETTSLLGITLDECPTCGGTWLDKGEIETLIAHAKKQKSTPTTRTKILNTHKQSFNPDPDNATTPTPPLEICPNCAKKMRSIIRFAVEIDICQSCYGIWCAPNESNLLHSHAQHSITGHPKHPSNKAKNNDTDDFYNWMQNNNSKHSQSLSPETETWLKEQNSSDQEGIIGGLALFGYIFTQNGIRKRRFRDLFL